MTMENDSKAPKCPHCQSSILPQIIDEHDSTFIMCINSECLYPFNEPDISLYYISKRPLNQKKKSRSSPYIKKRPSIGLRSKTLPYLPPAASSSDESLTSSLVNGTDPFDSFLPDVLSCLGTKVQSPTSSSNHDPLFDLQLPDLYKSTSASSTSADTLLSSHTSLLDLPGLSFDSLFSNLPSEDLFNLSSTEPSTSVASPATPDNLSSQNHPFTSLDDIMAQFQFNVPELSSQSCGSANMLPQLSLQEMEELLSTSNAN